MSTSVKAANIGSDIFAKERTSMIKRFAITVAVLVIVFCAPMVAGYKYQMLPFALWSIGGHRIEAGMVMHNGQQQPVYSGYVLNCGFFSLSKDTPVDWHALGK